MKSTFEQLLLKKLLGIITKEEEQDFELLLKVNPSFADIYQTRKKEWEAQQTEEPDISEDAVKPINVNVNKPGSKLIFVGNVVALLLMIAATVLSYQGISVSARKIVADEKVVSLTLSDHTFISLKPHSTIRIPNGFPATRSLELQGQAYFNVKHTPGKSLVINTESSRVEVAGTSFAVLSDEEDSGNEVIVFNGRVRMSSQQNTGESVVITPGMRGKVVNQSDLPILTRIDTVNLLAWKTDRLTFRNATLYDVAHSISSYYGVDVNVHNGITPCHFTATFNAVSLDEVLAALGESMPVEVTNDKRTITLDATKCDE